MQHRNYLTTEEIQHLLAVPREGKFQTRDYCMIHMCFIHGLRVSELTGMLLTDYDPHAKKLLVRRLKGGLSTVHPILAEENIMLQRWLHERRQLPGYDTPWLFITRQGGRLSRQRFYQLLRRSGTHAQLPLRVHPHMLRHACGYELAENGNDTRLIQDYLGHRNIRHTVHYTAANAERFIKAWQKSDFDCTTGRPAECTAQPNADKHSQDIAI
ncbi:tyrosine-type recombinase/integrase [Serratia marcescens]|nr:tyrosine-type recombinase/integrase [Serratia marcescens]MBH2766654.1 tyrosine-type recombinase/integrase [Serratia marcescens]MBH2766714.1 tyrosine-type recombinase/integrase [Serratia marcescens]